jgi:hypothetical protein
MTLHPKAGQPATMASETKTHLEAIVGQAKVIVDDALVISR